MEAWTPLFRLSSRAGTSFRHCEFVQAAKGSGVPMRQSFAPTQAQFKELVSRDSFIAEESYKWSGLPFVNLGDRLISWNGCWYPCSSRFSQMRASFDLPVGKGLIPRLLRRTKVERSPPILKSPEGLIGQTINLSGPVEMDHEQRPRN